MDCNAFDEAALDLLYDEERLRGRAGDELRRHVEGCSRCSGALAALQRGRDAALLEPLPVPAGLEASILAAVEQQQELQNRSWLRTFDKFLSLAGSYAMRPQAAMAVLMVLMVGMSLLLLRARPAGPGAVRITEDGVPALDAPARAAATQIAAAPATALPEKRAAADVAAQKKTDEERAPSKVDASKERPEAAAVAAAELTAKPDDAADDTKEDRLADATAVTAEAAPAAATAPSATTAPVDAAYAAANEDYKARRYTDAVRGFDIVAKGGGANAPMAALLAARSTRYSSGCGAALPRFDNLASRFVGTSVAAEATWDSANCYREVGQFDRARQLFQAMRRVAGYRDRAEKELTSLAQREADRLPATTPKAAASK